MNKFKLILVTGATGYVGGRLIPRLLEAGYDVRILVRNQQKLNAVTWRKRVQINVGDVLEQASLLAALEGVDGI